MILLYQIVMKDNRILDRTFPAMFKEDGVGRQIYEVIRGLKDHFDVDIVGIEFERRYGQDKRVVWDLFFNDKDLMYYGESFNTEVLLGRLKKLLWKRLALQRIDKLKSAVEIEDDPLLLKQMESLMLIRRRLLVKKSSFNELLESTVERVNTEGDLVHTCFDFIEKRTNGLTRKAMSSILAMPGHLKSTFLDALMIGTVRLPYNYRGLVISLEDAAEERIKRMAANILGLSLRAMRFKELKLNYQEIKAAFDLFSDRLTVLDPRTITKPEEAVVAINDVKPDFVIVDHIQNFDIADMVQGLIRAARQLEVAAIRNDCHVMIASQVKDKEVALREIKKPTVHDAQWTSTLHQKSAEMFGAFYQYKQSKNPMVQHTLDFDFLKSRFSDAIDEIKLHVDPDKGRIIGEINRSS